MRRALVLGLALMLAPVAGSAQQGAPSDPGQSAPGQIAPGPAAQGQPGQGQQGQVLPGQLRSPVLTIDTERLFNDSLFGKRVLQEIVTGTEGLAAENRSIEAGLIQEERDLARRRPAMEPEIFRTAAEAFDTRVQEIRRVQDAKQRALQEALSEGREAFLAAVGPVLGNLMRESGAAVILDRRSVFLGVGIVDVTDEAINAIDAAIGDGAGPGMPVPQEGAAPQEGPQDGTQPQEGPPEGPAPQAGPGGAGGLLVPQPPSPGDASDGTPPAD